MKTRVEYFAGDEFSADEVSTECCRCRRSISSSDPNFKYLKFGSIQVIPNRGIIIIWNYFCDYCTQVIQDTIQSTDKNYYKYQNTYDIIKTNAFNLRGMYRSESTK